MPKLLPAVLHVLLVVIILVANHKALAFSITSIFCHPTNDYTTCRDRTSTTQLFGRKPSSGSSKQQKRRTSRQNSDDLSSKTTPASVTLGVPPPTSYKHSSLRIQCTNYDATGTTTSSYDGRTSSYTNIVMCEINDPDWWQAKTLLETDDANTWRSTTGDSGKHKRQAADNPFGTRAWPPSLVVAQVLMNYHSSSVTMNVDENTISPFLQDRPILELGCGTGMVSITAAKLGGNVLATDVSGLALELTRRGWDETRKKRAANKKDDASTEILGSLSTELFDVTSNQPLPIPRYSPVDDATTTPPSDNNKQPIMIATSVLYEAHLAEAMARRVVEAVELGAWVIVGDCDSGQRDGGRQRFEKELDEKLIRLAAQQLSNEKVEATGRAPSWLPAVAKCSQLGWTEKHVRILHLNRPEV